MVGARVRRQQVAYAEGRGLSRRRACALLSVARSTLGYVSRLIARDAPLLPSVRTLAGSIRATAIARFGSFSSERATCWAPSDVSPVAAGGASGAEEAAAPPRGDRRPRPLKCLTVIDEFTRECLAIDVAGGIRSGLVIEVLAQLVSVHGAPRHLRSDNGLP
jgi:putative transposase